MPTCQPGVGTPEAAEAEEGAGVEAGVKVARRVLM
jgi:hypothetical protein